MAKTTTKKATASKKPAAKKKNSSVLSITPAPPKPVATKVPKVPAVAQETFAQQNARLRAILKRIGNRRFSESSFQKSQFEARQALK